MRKILFIFLLVFFMGIPAFASDNELVDDYYDMAKNFFNAGDYSAATEYANQILTINPKHFGAKYLSIKLTPPDTNLDTSKLYTQIVVRPYNSQTGYDLSDKYNAEGENYYSKKKYNSAKTSFLTSIKKNPENKYAYNNLGLTYWQQNNYKNAERCFKMSYSKDSKFIAPLINLIQMNIQQDKLVQAERYIKLVLNENDKDYCVYYLAGIIDKKNCNYYNAIKKFNTVVQICPGFALAYLQLADTYKNIKEYNWSNSSIEKYIKLSPNDDYAYYILAKNYSAMDDYNIAKNYIITAMNLKNCIEYRIELANIEDKSGNTLDAINTLKIIQNPTAEIFNQIGCYYLKIKENKMALEYFKVASLSKKTRPIYFYNMAQVYKNMGDMENYQKQIKAIESFAPISTQDYIDLSAISLDDSNKNKALAVLDKGIKVYGKNCELYEAKLRIYELTSDKAGIEMMKEKIKKEFN